MTSTRAGTRAPGLVIDHDDVAREQLRHAGRVVIDDELVELDRKRQVLDQRTIGLIQDRGRHVLPFGYPRVAAERRVRLRQPMLGRNLVDHRVRVDRRLIEQPHLQLDRQIAVEQAAEADHDDREVRGDVAELRQRATLRGDQRRAVRLARDELVAELRRQPYEHRRRLRARAVHRELTLVMERAQAAFSNLVLPALRVGDHLRRISDHAERHRHHQEAENQHEPPRAVHRVEAQRAEDVRPERTELVDVVGIRIVLREDGTDDAGDRQNDEQRNGETHRAQELDGAAHDAIARLRLQTRRGDAHSISD
ncbi:hypothetical protein OKW36_007998 [Paraburkholderia sp. MM5482-R1]